MIHQTDSKSPQPVAEAESLVGVAMHDLLAFFERWEAVRDENWGSGDYTKQSLGSRTDALLKEFRPLAEKIRQSALVEAWDTIDQMIPRGKLPGEGNGCDPQAQRNGMVMACNAVMKIRQANDERMHHYQRGRTSITGLRLKIREIIETGRLVVVA